MNNLNQPSNASTELRQILMDAYGLIAPEVTLIRTGGDGNQTFQVVAHGTKTIARIYGDQARQNLDLARYEQEMLAHLAHGGISVAAPIADLNGEWMQFLAVENASLPAPVALFTFAEGGVEWPTLPPRAHLLGAAFAQLHKAADDFRTSALPRVFDVERLFTAPLRLIRNYLEDSDPVDSAAWKTLNQTAERSASLLTAIPDFGGAIGPIHGDLHQGNCHFTASDRGDRLTFFDFSNAGSGWRVYDLSGFLWPLRDDTIENPAIREACDAFLAGYRSARPLLLEEERAIPASVKARDFWETGCWLEFGGNLDHATVRGGLHSLAAQFRRFPLPD